MFMQTQGGAGESVHTSCTSKVVLPLTTDYICFFFSVLTDRTTKRDGSTKEEEEEETSTTRMLPAIRSGVPRRKTMAMPSKDCHRARTELELKQDIYSEMSWYPGNHRSGSV